MKLSVYRSGLQLLKGSQFSPGRTSEKHQGVNYVSIQTQANHKLDIAIGDYITYDGKELVCKHGAKIRQKCQ